MRNKRSSKPCRRRGACGLGRHLCIESLESRQLLSITLPSLANETLSAGTAIYVPLAGSDPGNTISYSVTASDYSKLTTVMTPQSNNSLELTVDINGVDETMDFRLFDNLRPAPPLRSSL